VRALRDAEGGAHIRRGGDLVSSFEAELQRDKAL